MFWDGIRLWWHADGLHSLRAGRRLQAVERLPKRPEIRVASFLIEMLQDPYEEIRAAAAKKLGQLKTPRCIAPLVKLLLHEHEPAVRDAAAESLAPFPADGWVPSLVAALDDPDFKVRESASAALRSIGWPFIDDAVRGRVAVIRCDWPLAAELGAPAVPALQAALRSGTSVVRRDAAGALCKIADKSALTAIVEVLRDRRVEPNAREIAAWALRNLQWHEVEPIDAARAAIALGRWSEVIEIGTDAVAPLNNALKDQNPTVRRSAAETLGAIGDRAAAEALAAALVDQGQNSSVRVASAQQLARIGGDYVVAFLTAGLSDKEWSVRTAVAKALDEMFWKPSRPWDRALYAIAKQRIEDAVAVGPTAIPALAEALRFPAVSNAIGAALMGMGQEGAEALAVISRDEKSELALREAASTALASAGDARAVEPLHAMLKDADPAVRHSAVWALERLGWKPEADVDRAVVALAHEDWTTLARIGPAAVEPLLRSMMLEGGCPKTAETLLKVVDAHSGRMSIDQLRKVARLADPTASGSATATSAADTATLARPEVTKLAKTAKYELIRRGIMK